MAIGAIHIEGTAVEQETVNESENENKVERFTVEREIDVDVLIELKEGHPNLDYYRNPGCVLEEVKNKLNGDSETLYHSIEIDRVYLSLYNIGEQAKVFASERPKLSQSRAMEKMVKWNDMEDIRYGE